MHRDGVVGATGPVRQRHHPGLQARLPGEGQLHAAHPPHRRPPAQAAGAHPEVPNGS